MILEWKKSYIELIAVYIHPKNSNHLRSHLRAIMALDHRRLISGKKIRPTFLRSTSLLCKILPTNLSACKPTFYTIYTSHLRWNLGWIFIRKKDGVNVPALTKHPGNFSVKKEAKNVLRRKSYICFNQEAARKIYTLSSQWLGFGLWMDSRFRLFSHWFPVA